MANELYKDHVLVSTSSYNSTNQCWAASVSISWRDGANFHFHRFDGTSNSYHTAEDAIANGLQPARLWVDKKL